MPSPSGLRQPRSYDKALEWLAEAGFDPLYGARPLKRVIQRTLQDGPKVTRGNHLRRQYYNRQL